MYIFIYVCDLAALYFIEKFGTHWPSLLSCILPDMCCRQCLELNKHSYRSLFHRVGLDKLWVWPWTLRWCDLKWETQSFMLQSSCTELIQLVLSLFTLNCMSKGKKRKKNHHQWSSNTMIHHGNGWIKCSASILIHWSKKYECVLLIFLDICIQL